MKRFIENRPSSDTARRPLPPLAGNLLFLGALFAMSLLVMAIEKPLFLLWYHAQAAEASAAELALVVWNGLKLDQTVAGYITALPLLVVLAALWIPGRWSRSVLKGYLLVIAAVAATAFAANLALYEYWAFPLDSSVLQYLASPKEALASVTAGQLLLQLLVAAAVFGGMAWCYLRVLRLYDPARRSTHRAGSTLVLLLAAGVLFLPIRGGVSVATANVSKVYFSGRMFLNHAAVNPLFSFSRPCRTVTTPSTNTNSFPNRSVRRSSSRYAATCLPGSEPTRCCAPDGRTSCCSWSKASAARRSTSVSEANP
ncbi:MAG: hypothetical protein V8Q31_00085 [Alistipes communis]